MKQITFHDLIGEVAKYDIEAIQKVKEAYALAATLHDGKKRKSGEPYIIHPLNVAYTLAKLHFDCDTICAGLLHDVIEDTQITKEDLAILMNPDIAMLVEGVTKEPLSNFVSKPAQNAANTRKIVTSLLYDVRIICIKLADRLHNMQTLEYMSDFKKLENAKETMDIFVPIAYSLGAHKLENELGNLALHYLSPDLYQKINEKKNLLEEEERTSLKEVVQSIHHSLQDAEISNEVKSRVKDIYGIYKKLRKGYQWEDIHDLLSLKITVADIAKCYQALEIIRSKYLPLIQKEKDYICNPKTTKYQSLHITVFGNHFSIIQMQIRTPLMAQIAEDGLMAFRNIDRIHARERMQQELKVSPFYKTLLEMDQTILNDEDFVSQAKRELFTDKIYIYTPKGEVVELPQGSTPIDFAYHLDSTLGNQMVAATVNEKKVPFDYELKTKDRLRILTSEHNSVSRDNWETLAITTHAKRKIKESHNSKR